MTRKLLKLISDGQKSIEVNHGQLLKLIMVKQKTIDIIQGQILKLFSVRKNSVEFITLLKLLLSPVRNILYPKNLKRKEMWNIVIINI